MSTATQQMLIKAFKPYDIVTDENNNVGFINEVDVNECQDGFDDQINYSVEWLVGEEYEESMLSAQLNYINSKSMKCFKSNRQHPL